MPLGKGRASFGGQNKTHYTKYNLITFAPQHDFSISVKKGVYC